jgi:hypothetical protein
VNFDKFFERNAFLFRIEIKNLTGDEAETT